MKYVYENRGTCSRQTIIELEGDVIKSCQIVGGCNGNTKGICKLVTGMKADDVIERCKGITCGFKPTSCPDQLAKALLTAKEAQEK